MLQPWVKIMLSALSDFVVTGGSTLLGAVMATNSWSWPTPIIWLVAGITGLVGAFRHVQALMSDLGKSSLLLPAVLLLSGCAAFGSPPSAYQQMTADQIREVVKDKAASIVCTHGDYAGASITVVAVNADKGVPSGITVDKGCGVTVDTKVTPKP